MPESGGVYLRVGENGNCSAGPNTWQWASQANGGGTRPVGELAIGRGPGTVRSSGNSCGGFVVAISVLQLRRNRAGENSTVHQLAGGADDPCTLDVGAVHFEDGVEEPGRVFEADRVASWRDNHVSGSRSRQ